MNHSSTLWWRYKLRSPIGRNLETSGDKWVAEFVGLGFVKSPGLLSILYTLLLNKLYQFKRALLDTQWYSLINIHLINNVRKIFLFFYFKKVLKFQQFPLLFLCFHFTFPLCLCLSAWIACFEFNWLKSEEGFRHIRYIYLDISAIFI